MTEKKSLFAHVLINAGKTTCSYQRVCQFVVHNNTAQTVESKFFFSSSQEFGYEVMGIHAIECLRNSYDMLC